LYITDDSIDDLLRKVFIKIKSSGNQISNTRGTNLEILGVNIRLKNPKSRISKSLKKGKIFSALGELLWYLSGQNTLELIRHYLPGYDENSDDGLTVHGGYGPRLFNRSGINQIENILNLLKKNPNTRRAVIQLFESSDLVGRHKDIPCTTSLQFIVRDNYLHMFVTMRSNDAFKGLPHDIFAFTMIQEIIAKSLDLKLGNYNHSVSSLHLYEEDLAAVSDYLNEGYQVKNIMPDMPIGDPWKSINHLLEIEAGIRTGNKTSSLDQSLNCYWQDIAHVLQFYKYFRDKKFSDCEAVIETIKNPFYHPYLKEKQASATQKEQLKLL